MNFQLTDIQSFRAIIQHLSERFDYITFNCKHDGFIIRNLDKLRVMVVEVIYHDKSFTSYECKVPCTSTVESKHLSDVLNLYDQKTHSKIQFQINEQKGLQITFGSIDIQIPLSKISVLRSEPNFEWKKWKGDVEISKAELVKSLNQINLMADEDDSKIVRIKLDSSLMIRSQLDATIQFQTKLPCMRQSNVLTDDFYDFNAIYLQWILQSPIANNLCVALHLNRIIKIMQSTDFGCVKFYLAGRKQPRSHPMSLRKRKVQ